MLVPRSFKYSTSPPPRKESSNEERPRSGRLFKQAARSDPIFVSSQRRPTPPQSPPSAMTHNSTMPSTPQPSKPLEIPSRRSSLDMQTSPAIKIRGQRAAVRKSRHSEDSAHRSDALPPAVAALLAVTAIPPPRANQMRRKKANCHSSRQISIDELVQEWRNDSSLRTSFGSSTSMDMLLESADESGDEFGSRSDGGDEHLFASRSTSCDSIPSLDADDRSVMSVGSPATPESLHSSGSGSITPRKEKSFSPLETEECGLDHPLVRPDIYFSDLDEFVAPSPTPKEGRNRKSSSFKSNLTSSLQALKSKALSSWSSLNLSATDSFSDDTLWQHPYLFPRFSHEIRPIDFSTSPTCSERRYLNPHPSTPVSFEEQQHHWQDAFSSSFDDLSSSPMIQMQTYKRTSSSRKSSRRSSSSNPDPRSEAGRAMSGSAPVLSRQREPRENSDFLRVVVLEMNMRREGKLEERAAGRARIWLPPRKAPSSRDGDFDEESRLCEKPIGRRIPKRWVGITLE